MQWSHEIEPLKRHAKIQKRKKIVTAWQRQGGNRVVEKSMSKYKIRFECTRWHVLFCAQEVCASACVMRMVSLQMQGKHNPCPHGQLLLGENQFRSTFWSDKDQCVVLDICYSKFNWLLKASRLDWEEPGLVPAELSVWARPQCCFSAPSSAGGSCHCHPSIGGFFSLWWFTCSLPELVRSWIWLAVW